MRILAKEYVSSGSATNGMTAYNLEGQGDRLATVDLSAWLAPAKINRVARLHFKARQKLGKTVTVDIAAHEAATSPLNLKRPPTDRQKHSGGYAKGHIKIGGVEIAIENPAGSKRRPEWKEMTAHYGYAKRTEGADGDGVDVFVKVGTATDYDGPVFIVDQVLNRMFDEHKVMIGWKDAESARAAYLSNYEPGWKGLGAITEMEYKEFKSWLKTGDTTAPVGLKQKGV